MKSSSPDNLIIKKVDMSNWEREFMNSLDMAHQHSWLGNLKNRVVIKPNLCNVASPESGVTTDVRLVEYLIRFLRHLSPNMDISIIESNNFERDAEEVFERLGYEGLKQEYQVDLVNLSNEPSFEVKLKDIPYTMNVPKLFFEDLFFISVALPKTHAYQKITAIYKNQFGCIPDKFKERYHQYLEEALYILNNRLFVPNLCIIDGRVGMERYGPADGDRVESRFILLSGDATVADINCAWLMGFNPPKIPYLRYACKKKGIEINSIQEPAKSLCRKYSFVPMWQYRVIRGKIKVTRATIALNNKGKRMVYIFFRLPSYLKERKLIPLHNRLKMKWNGLMHNNKHLLNKVKN